MERMVSSLELCCEDSPSRSRSPSPSPSPSPSHTHTTQLQKLLSATNSSDFSSNTQRRERLFSEKRQQTVPGWDSMASNDHTNPKYEIVKHIMIDIKPEDLMNINQWIIYKVPCNLRRLNDDAYTPQLVSIGPLHYGQTQLLPMQKHKLRYLDLFRSRVIENKTEVMDRFKEYLKKQEKEIRKRYDENISYDKISEEKMVDMLLLDSVFIMELFLRFQKQKLEEEESKNNKNVGQIKQKNSYDDVILKQTWLNKSIQRDLLLLENQIPLSILKKLYDTVVPENDKKRPTFVELAIDYFECFHTYKKADSCPKQDNAARSFFNGEPSKDNNSSGSNLGKMSSSRYNQLKQNWGDNYDPQHFTDLIRSFYICKNLKVFKKGSPLKIATKLSKSGVSFEKVINKPLVDIRFEKLPILSWFLCLGCITNSTYFKARLQIPELKIDETTVCVLRNLIAFEQCYYPDKPYICNYVSFIDSLIHTKDDVELLVEKEVIMHELGSDTEVASLVNSLCKYVVTDKTCYADTINKLNKHYHRQWNRTMAALRLVYFRDTWRATSTLVGILVLVFTSFNFSRVVRFVLEHDKRS